MDSFNTCSMKGTTKLVSKLVKNEEIHFKVKIREDVKKERCSSYVYNIFTKYLCRSSFSCNFMITS